jgi:hypothetical protein
MNDLEISKALALAIGWKLVTITRGIDPLAVVHTGNPRDNVKSGGLWFYGYRIFDYRDWAVAGPIAEKYECFPGKNGTAGWWMANTPNGWSHGSGDTPQKAIALAVIGSVK